jgi:tetratricopeptide (TPR) repeat protein
MRRAPALLLALGVWLGAGPAAAQDPHWVGAPEVREPSPAARERMARSQLESGRSLLREGRPELAEAALRRGLEFEPRHAGLQRELARALDAQGQAEAAAEARALADALDPPPPPLPDQPAELPSQGLLVVLVPPLREGGTERSPRGWPGGEAAGALAERLRVRLPRARVVNADFESVAAARTWLASRAPRAVLSLRVDRVYCGDSIKDGPFALAWLRAAAEAPGPTRARPVTGRAVVQEPRLPRGCRAEATARALEEVLALPALRDVLASPGASGRWSTASIRALFPGLGERIDAQLDEGAQLLSQGRIEDAARAFRRAARVDGEDSAVLTYLHEAEATLALSSELSGRRPGPRRGEAGVLDPRLSEAQRAALEARLAEEQRRREELLAALAVMDEDARLPSQEVLAALRPAPVRDPEAFGAALARDRAGGQVEARAAYAPDGSVIARYYFPVGDALPVLREEDLDQDRRPDRWIAYAGNQRAEIWESGRDTGRPDLRMVFGGADGRVVRIEIDRDGDGRPERVFHYSGEDLTSEARDTNGDGILDTFDRLDAQGRVVLREEDRDGDGHIDVRSHYQAGRLVRRELSQGS